MAVVAAEVLPGFINERERPSDIESQVALHGLHAVASREPNILNEYGIVEPPPAVECPGHHGKECFLTRHHLHSTAPDYELEGKLATGFRDLAVLTVWLPECAHREHHNQYDIHVPIPNVKIMKRASYEAGKIKQLVTNFRINNNNENLFHQPDLTEKGEKGLRKVRDRLAEEKTTLLDKIIDLEVIPHQLITGALLLVDPDTARHRISKEGDWVLPGVLTRAEVPTVYKNSQEILEEAA